MYNRAEVFAVDEIVAVALKDVKCPSVPCGARTYLRLGVSFVCSSKPRRCISHPLVPVRPALGIRAAVTAVKKGLEQDPILWAFPLATLGSSILETVMMLLDDLTLVDHPNRVPCNLGNLTNSGSAPSFGSRRVTIDGTSPDPEQANGGAVM